MLIQREVKQRILRSIKGYLRQSHFATVERYIVTKTGNNMEAVIIHFARQIMLMVPSADKHIEIPSGVMYDDEQTRRGPPMRPRMVGKKSRHGRSTETLSLSLILPEWFRGRESEKELEVLRLARVSAFQNSKREAYAVMSTRILTENIFNSIYMGHVEYFSLLFCLN